MRRGYSATSMRNDTVLVNPKQLLFYPCKTFSPGLISGNGFVYEATLHVAVIFKSIPCTMIIIYAICLTKFVEKYIHVHYNEYSYSIAIHFLIQG